MTTYTGQAVEMNRRAGGILLWAAIVLMNIWVPILTILETAVAIAVFPLLLVLWRLATRWPLGKIIRHFVRMYGRVWLWIMSPFVRVKLTGADRRRLARPCIYVANHLSFFDIFVMSVLPVFDVVICLRSWPFRLFCYAPFMRMAEYLDVESLPWDEVVQRVQRMLEEGRSILVFPQGHRSRDGRLGRFYSGAFKLAALFNAPVIPLCISGTDRLLPPGRRWMAPAEVRLECLEPVEPAAFQRELGHVELRKHVKELMGACLARNQS